MNYIVQWDYRSGMGGPWAKGDQVGLDEAQAAAINRDSPGVLVPAEVIPGTAAVTEAPRDRMVKQSRRRDREGDPGDQGMITRSDFKATKGG